MKSSNSGEWVPTCRFPRLVDKTGSDRSFSVRGGLKALRGRLRAPTQDGETSRFGGLGGARLSFTGEGGYVKRLGSNGS